MPGRASIVFMSGNQGGIGSDGKNPGTVCAYECPAPAGQAPDGAFCAGTAPFRCNSDSDCPKESCGWQRNLGLTFLLAPKEMSSECRVWCQATARPSAELGSTSPGSP